MEQEAKELAKELAIKLFEEGAIRFLEGEQPEVSRPCVVIATHPYTKESRIFFHPCEAESEGFIESETDFETAEWELNDINPEIRLRLRERGLNF